MIYYTTDGTDPTLSSKTATGKKKLSINATTTVKAFTVEAGKIKSAVATSTYTYVEASSALKGLFYVCLSGKLKKSKNVKKCKMLIFNYLQKKV